MALERADADVTTATFAEQWRSLGRPYWIANLVEMLERFGYYGLRTVLPVYMVLAVEAGGPEFTHVQKGAILAWWAGVQTFVPIVSGGWADRYGYRLTVGVSIAIKVAGYLVMGWAVDVAAVLSGGASTTTPGHDATYAVFLAGAMLLALGTAVFKPGIQGLVAQHVTDRNASLAWSTFYQVVNVGGFLGPFLAGWMRLLAWRWVFVACALIVSVNWLLLLALRDPPRRAGVPREGFLRVLDRGLAGILEPRLFAFLVVFSGFWSMFYQLFDLLPNFIDDWVDSRSVHAVVVAPLFALVGGAPPSAWGGEVPQEYLINLNAGMIALLSFGFGYVTGKMRSITAMIVGIVVSAVGILGLGQSVGGWAILGCVAVFSAGEMLASPTKIRYFSTIAPPGEQGRYLGYVNATTGIGWSLGSLLAGRMYEEGGDKVGLARRHLVEAVGLPAPEVEALAKTEVLPTLAARLATDEAAVETLLWTTYAPGSVWTWFAGIGLVSMVGLVGFDAITRRAGRSEEPSLVVLTGLVAGLCYGPWVGAGFAGVMALRAAVGNAWAWRTVAVGAVAWVSWGAAWG